MGHSRFSTAICNTPHYLLACWYFQLCILPSCWKEELTCSMNINIDSFLKRQRFSETSRTSIYYLMLQFQVYLKSSEYFTTLCIVTECFFVRGLNKEFRQAAWWTHLCPSWATPETSLINWHSASHASAFSLLRPTLIHHKPPVLVEHPHFWQQHHFKDKHFSCNIDFCRKSNLILFLILSFCCFTLR